jgi:hypothetical protein
MAHAVQSGMKLDTTGQLTTERTQYPASEEWMQPVAGYKCPKSTGVGTVSSRRGTDDTHQVELLVAALVLENNGHFGFGVHLQCRAAQWGCKHGVTYFVRWNES